jgi:hypothetical protein
VSNEGKHCTTLGLQTEIKDEHLRETEARQCCTVSNVIKRTYAAYGVKIVNEESCAVAAAARARETRAAVLNFIVGEDAKAMEGRGS